MYSSTMLVHEEFERVVEIRSDVNRQPTKNRLRTSARYRVRVISAQSGASEVDGYNSVEGKVKRRQENNSL